GTSVQDDATVGGAVAGVPAPTGTVTYHFFMGATEVGTGETVPVGTDSTPTAGLTAGSYHYVVHYSGDANYLPSDSAVEPLTVHPAPTTTTTVIALPGAGVSPPAALPVLGTSVQDDATVGGAVAGVPAPTGTVTYHFFMGATEVGTGETVPV